jgi:hypothetical protein
MSSRVPVAVFALLALVPSLARAEFPYPKCGGPQAPSCTNVVDYQSYLFLPTTDPPTIPSDLSATNFRYSSLVDPAVPATAQELFGVRGPSIDKAWQITTGRPDVVIAVLDSGIKWNDVGDMNDLAAKVHLNAAERRSPRARATATTGTATASQRPRLPGDGTHSQDSRVSDQNGNGIIDPQDLIKIFLRRHRIDDGNGYVDDIAGWTSTRTTTIRSTMFLRPRYR